MEIKKIVACVDLTPTSIKGLEWAVELARKFEAELVIYHELEDVYTMIKTSASFGVPAAPDLEEKSAQNVKDKIEPLVKEAGINYRFLIEAKGKTIDRLPVVIDEEKPELTVIPVDYERDIPKINSQVLVIK